MKAIEIAAALATVVGTVVAFLTYNLSRRQFAQNLSISVHNIYVTILYAAVSAQAADRACILNEAKTLIAVIEGRLGDVLALCPTLGGQVKDLREALEGKPKKKPEAKPPTTVTAVPAGAVIIDIDHGAEKEKGPTGEEAVDEHLVRVRMAVDRFATFWSERASRIGQLERAQRTLNHSPPPPAASDEIRSRAGRLIARGG